MDVITHHLKNDVRKYLFYSTLHELKTDTTVQQKTIYRITYL